MSSASVLNDAVEMDRDDQDDPAEEDNNDNGGDDGADDDADDREVSGFDGESYRDFDVRRVYTLSNNFFDEEIAEDFDIVDEDPISQYSFAFAIRPARQDASLGIQFPDSSNLVPAGELYEVDIMVFRTFREGTRNALYVKEVMNHFI